VLGERELRALTAGGENVVPVVGGGAEAEDGGMQSDHPVGRRIAGFVGVEAAVDFVAAGNQCGEPGRIGSNAGGGEAEAIRMHLAVADRIDGGLAEDDLPGGRGAKPEEPPVFARAGRHPAPDARPGAT